MMLNINANTGGAPKNPFLGPKVAEARATLNKIRDLRRTGQIDAARRAALNAMELWHLSAPMVRLIGNMKWPEDQYPVICKRLAEIGRTATGLVREECVVALKVFGADDAAAELLNTEAEGPAPGPKKNLLRDLLYAPRSRTDRPSANFDDRVIIDAVKPGSKRCLVIFSGTFNGIGIPMPLFDQITAPLDTHILYLRDSHRTLFLTGIHGHSDSFEGGVDILRQRVAALGATEIYTLGTSSGGVGAIKYGLALGSSRIMAMSAPVNLHFDFMSQDGRIHAVYRSLYDRLTPEEYDVRSFIEKAKSPSKIILYHGDSHTQDAAHARSIADMPGVEIRPVADYGGHNVLRPLMERGQLLSTMSELLEIPPA